MTSPMQGMGQAGAPRVEEDVCAVLARVTSENPDAVAVETHNRRLTYTELDQLSGATALHLDNLLGQDHRPVAFWIDEPTDLIAAIVGSLRCGRPFAPISRRNPPARRRAMLADLAPAAVVSADHLMEEARAAGVDADRLFSIEALRHGRPGARVSTPADALAAIYYTSGSTGEPKGVMRSRALIAERGRSEQARYGIHPGDRHVMCYSLSAAASLSSIFGTLFGGGTLHAYEADLRGMTDLTEIVSAPGSAMLRIPAELLRSWVRNLAPEAFFPSLRYIGSAGDVVYRRDLLALSPHVRPELKFGTQYAMSEFGILTSTTFPISGLPPDEIVPVGRPIGDREILIIDPEGRALPAGEIGEICLRAYPHQAGYWNRPDLNSEMVLPDPADGGRMLYRTGDLGTFNPDGQLVLAGRKDQRVKIRGFTVDMSAVESALMRAPGVARGVVVARQQPTGERRIVAYVVPAAGHSVDRRSLRQALSAGLPDYMLPSRYVILKEVPLTRTGKVDRQALLESEDAASELGAEKAEPRDAIERKLAELWRHHLRVGSLGIDDEFFDLGGDSLLAASLMASVEKEFKRPLLVTTMLRAPTIRKQAEILRSATAEDDDPVLFPVRTAGQLAPLFCLGGKGGTPIRFRALVERIDKNRPVYYLRSFGLKKGERTVDFVEEIAAKYLQEVRRVRPNGPYLLLGESGGGLVAYELAQQLMNAGEKIAFLGLLDTYLPSYRNRRSTVGTLLRKHTQTMTSGGLSGLRVYFAYYAGLLGFKFRRYADAIRARLRNVLRSDALSAYARVERANVRASRAYAPRPYPGTVHLFHAARQARYERNASANGWGEAGIADLVVYPLNCYHGNVLFEPFVSEVARTLDQYSD